MVKSKDKVVTAIIRSAATVNDIVRLVDVTSFNIDSNDEGKTITTIKSSNGDAIIIPMPVVSIYTVRSPYPVTAVTRDDVILSHNNVHACIYVDDGEITMIQNGVSKKYKV